MVNFLLTKYAIFVVHIKILRLYVFKDIKNKLIACYCGDGTAENIQDDLDAYLIK